MNITRETNFFKSNFVIRIPTTKQRSNPYDEREHGEMPSLVGLIVHHEEWDECGFAYPIDRAYKGKDDDVTAIQIVYDGSASEFVDVCLKLGIGVESVWENEVATAYKNPTISTEIG